MKINLSKKLLLITFCLVLSAAYCIPIYSYAADVIEDYKPLAPLPDFRVNNQGNQNLLEGYLPNVFIILIGVVAVLAIIRIIWGGVIYITTDAIQGKEEGRKYINQAVIGLCIVGASWIIMRTFVPNLFDERGNFNLDISITADRLVDGVIGTGGSGCTDCDLIPSTIRVSASSNRNISKSVLPKIESMNTALSGANITWQVTEANPPTGNHVDPCHTDGTCVDANFAGGTNASAANVNSFLNQARSNSSSASYEVKTEAAKNALINSGAISAENKSRIVINPAATGSHFHIEF